MFISEVTPLDQHLPAGSREAGAPADEPAGLGPGRLCEGAGLTAVPALEVDDLAFGDAQEQGLRDPLVVDMGLANPLDQVLCILVRG